MCVGGGGGVVVVGVNGWVGFCRPKDLTRVVSATLSHLQRTDNRDLAAALSHSAKRWLWCGHTSCRARRQTASMGLTHHL